MEEVSPPTLRLPAVKSSSRASSPTHLYRTTQNCVMRHKFGNLVSLRTTGTGGQGKRDLEFGVEGRKTGGERKGNVLVDGQFREGFQSASLFRGQSLPEAGKVPGGGNFTEGTTAFAALARAHRSRNSARMPLTHINSGPAPSNHTHSGICSSAVRRRILPGLAATTRHEHD